VRRRLIDGVAAGTTSPVDRVNHRPPGQLLHSRLSRGRRRLRPRLRLNGLIRRATRGQHAGDDHQHAQAGTSHDQIVRQESAGGPNSSASCSAESRDHRSSCLSRNRGNGGYRLSRRRFLPAWPSLTPWSSSRAGTRRASRSRTRQPPTPRLHHDARWPQRHLLGSGAEYRSIRAAAARSVTGVAFEPPVQIDLVGSDLVREDHHQPLAASRMLCLASSPGTRP
jgi:hypothetical protein